MTNSNNSLNKSITGTSTNLSFKNKFNNSNNANNANNPISLNQSLSQGSNHSTFLGSKQKRKHSKSNKDKSDNRTQLKLDNMFNKQNK
jgi:hypothetical protein